MDFSSMESEMLLAWHAFLFVVLSYCSINIFRKIRDSFTLYSYLTTLLVSTVWVVVIPVLRLTNFFNTSDGHIAAINYVFFALTTGTVSHSLLLAYANHETLKLRYWLFQINNILVAMLGGAFVGNRQDLPRIGELIILYSILSLASFLVYTVISLSSSYKFSMDDVLKFRLRSIFRVSAVGVVLSLVVLISIPPIPLSIFASTIAEVYVVANLTGMSVMATNGSQKYLESYLKDLLKIPEMSTDRAIDSASEFLGALHDSLGRLDSKGLPSVELSLLERNRTIEIEATSTLKEKVSLSKDENTKYEFGDLDPKIALDGLRTNVLSLEKENQRLQNILHRYKAIDSKLSYVQAKVLEKYEENGIFGVSLLRDSFKDSIFSFDQGYFVACSPQTRLALRQGLHYSKLSSSLCIEGDVGSGRSSLAKYLHFQRGGGKLFELNGLIEDDRSNLSKLLLDIKNTREQTGVIVRNFSALSSRQVSSLLEIIAANDSLRSIYLIADSNYRIDACNLNYYSYFPVTKHCLKLDPLESRPEDLLVHALLISQELARRAGVSFEGVSRNVVETLFSEHSGINLINLRGAIRAGLGDGAVLSKLDWDQKARIETADLNSENRKVLVSYLRANHFDVELTALEMGIDPAALRQTLVDLSISIPNESIRRKLV